jgi:hypothetical protein
MLLAEAEIGRTTQTASAVEMRKVVGIRVPSLAPGWSTWRHSSPEHKTRRTGDVEPPRRLRDHEIGNYQSPLAVPVTGRLGIV